MSGLLDAFFGDMENPSEQEFLWAANEVRESITNPTARTLLDMYVTNVDYDTEPDIDMAILGALAYFLQFAYREAKFSLLETILEVDVILHSLQLLDDEEDR